MEGGPHGDASHTETNRHTQHQVVPVTGPTPEFELPDSAHGGDAPWPPGAFPPPPVKRTLSRVSSFSEAVLGTRQSNFFAAWRSRPHDVISAKWFVTGGAEWTQVYIWILKDLSWTQLWYYPCAVLVPTVVVWSLFLLAKAFYKRNFTEIWHEVAKFLWLFSNSWWVWGEWHDEYYPGTPKIYDRCQHQSGIIIACSLGWLALYYVVLRPCGVAPRPSKEATHDYELEDIHVPPRKCCSVLFETWREYENLHVVLWMGKDLCWIWGGVMRWPYLVFMTCTLAIGVDFAILTSHERHDLVNHVHYLAQLCWVVANIAWSSGELFGGDLGHDPYGLFDVESRTLRSGRWVSSYVLLATVFLLLVLYLAWVPYSVWMYCTRLPPLDEEEGRRYSRLAAEDSDGAVWPDDHCD